MTKLFIGKLDYKTTEEELKEVFKAYNVTNVTIIKTPIGYSKGFGFVDVKTAEDAQKALEKDGAEVGKMKIRVQIAKTEEEKKAQPRRQTQGRRRFPRRRQFQGRRQGNRVPRRPRREQKEKTPRTVSKCGVYVKNLPFEMKEEEFAALFKAYETESIKLVMRKRQPEKNYGYGFVTAKTEDVQKKIIAEMNEKEVNGRKIGCSASYEVVEKK